jgi:hypothetical protein
MAGGLMSSAWRRLVELVRVVRGDRMLCVVFGLMFAIDLAWTLWWVWARILDNQGNHYWYEMKPLRIDADGGYPEWFNYLKTMLLIFLLGRLTWIRRHSIYAALTVTFAVILVDDMMEIHEEGGKYFKKTLDLEPMWGMRAVDFGEVITWLLLGTVLGPLMLIGLIRAKGIDRTNGLALLIPFAALVFFGLVVDQVYHILRDAFPHADVVLGGSEDGGEMLAITLACAMAAALVKLGADDDGSTTGAP